MKSLTDSDVRALSGARVVVVIGLSAAGKTTVTEEISEILSEHSVYHTDDYIDYGYEQSLYVLMKDLNGDPNPLKIVEGVQGFRFLRKNAQTGMFPVDAVVIVDCPHEERARRYAARRKEIPQSFDRNLETVFKGYLEEMKKAGQALPVFINVHT